MHNDPFRHKSIRDPLYGFIDLSETETKLIDTAVFRRLQNIKQLSHAYVVYPSAIHTRFEHALGVNHLAERVSQQLGFPDDVREIVRLAGLLHDIGHGPFSHLFEDVLANVNKTKIGHDEISRLIIKNNDEITSILGDKVDKIVQLLGHEKVEGWDESISTLATDVVSSPLDVDKLDYLRRDSYHIGVAYGQFDLARIIHTLTSTPDKVDKRLCVQGKGKDAIENYRLGRYLMHAQVYKHHARIVADEMFLRALDLAVNEEDIISPDKLKIDPSSETSVKNFLDFYTSLDDHSIYDQIIQTKPDSKSAGILGNIKKRKLLKRACDFLPDKEIEDALVRDKIMKMENKDLRDLSNEIADNLGLERHNVICYLAEIQVNLYDGEILILWKGIPRKLDEFSPIEASKSTINKFYIFCQDDPDTKQKIRKYVSENHKLPIDTKFITQE